MRSYRLGGARSGAALIEVVVALGIFVLFIVNIAHLVIGSQDGERNARQQTIATLYAQEGLEAARSVVERDFTLLTDGSHGLSTASGWYALTGSSSNVIDAYTRTLTVAPVRRNGVDVIVQTGGVIDDRTKALTSAVTWQVAEGRTATVRLFTYLTDWGKQTLQWIMDLTVDWQTGNRNGTVVAARTDGAVMMGQMGIFSNPSLRFSKDFTGSADVTEMQIDARSDRLYVTTILDASAPEFMAYDISNVSGNVLSLTGSVELGIAGDGFALSSDYAFVLTAADAAEIRVIRLSDFSIVATWDIPTGANPRDIVINEALNRAYVVTENSSGAEFYVLNIASPISASIPIISQTELGVSGLSVALYGGYAYVGTDSLGSELMIVTLAGPTVAGCNLTANTALRALVVAGSVLYAGHVGGGANELTAYGINAGDPGSCALLTGNVVFSKDFLTSTVTDIVVDTAAGYAFVTIANVSEELQVIALGTFVVTPFNLTGSQCDALFFLGAYLYAGCQDNAATVQVVEGGSQVSWSQLQLVGDGNVSAGNPTTNVVSATDTAIFLGTVLNNSGPEFIVYDTTAASGKVQIGSLEIGANVNDMVVVGNFAYLATSHDTRELMVVNIGNPAVPVLAGSYDADPGEGLDGLSVAVVGTVAYLGTASNTGTGDNEFYALNVSTLSSITKIGSYEISQNVAAIAIGGTVAYLATPGDTNEFIALNIAVPATITLRSAVDAPTNVNGMDVLVQGTILYAATQDDLYVYNVSNPSIITQLATFDYNNDLDALTLSADASTLFVATDTGGLDVRIFNVSTPASITQIGSLSLNGQPNDIFFYNDTVLLASADNIQKLQILRRPNLPVSYPRWATYTSPPFDASDAAAVWESIAWTQSGSGSLTFRIRTGSSRVNLLQGIWVGSGGTIGTVYDQNGGQNITTHPSATGTRWFQWKAYFTGQGTGSTILDDVTVTYQ